MNELKKEAPNLLRELEAILVLTNNVHETLRVQLAEQKRRLARLANKSALRREIQQLRSDVTKVRADLKVSTPANRLIEFLKLVEAAPPGKELMVPKHLIKDLLPGFDYHSPHFRLLPNHARIVIGVFGQFDWSLLEAKLYEDLCALFNLAKERTANLAAGSASRATLKAAEALVRAVVLAAFNFVEAYLNGLASDYYFENQEALDAATKSLLLDWDFQRQRPGYLSLRDKALKYPRIILRSKHPPLQESNCQELAYVAGRAKELRDAIVHPAPDVTIGGKFLVKERELFALDFAEAERIVDAAVALVRKLETSVSGNEDRLFWMRQRGADGTFPKSVFE